MSSTIISGVISICKTAKEKFKTSKLNSALERIYGSIGRSWQNSVITRAVKTENSKTKNSILSRVIMSPFALLEKISLKIGDKLSDRIDKSIICELGRSYVQNAMAINSRFIGIMALSMSLVYNILKFISEGDINKYIGILSVISAFLVIFNVNVMGFCNTSKLMGFIKKCLGFDTVSFDFWDNSYTIGRLRLVAGAMVGIFTGVVMFVSPIIGMLVPFAVFGMLLVLQYPITGVFAAVFLAPLISFSSMPLAGICIWTLLSLVIHSLCDKNFKWKREGVGIALLLFLAVLFVSSVFSFARKNSLVVWAMYFIFITFYFAVINLIDTKEKAYSLLKVFAISGALVALYGIMQYVFGWNTSNAWIDEEMFAEETMRVYSTLANPNVLGEYLLLVLPVSIVLGIKSKKKLIQLVYFAISAVVFVCLILTQSRGCWLGFMVSIALFITFYEGRWWTFAILALAFIPFVLPDTIMNRLMSIGDMGDSSTSYRVFIWMGTMGIVRNYFMGGIGMGEEAFARVYPLFSYNAIIAPHSHNTFLQLLVEGGIPALAVFIAIIAVFFKNTHSSYRLVEKKSFDSAMLLGIASGIAGFLFQSMFDYTFYNYRVMALFFMLIGINMALSFIVKADVVSKGADKQK